MENTTNATLFEQIGGKPAVNAAVDIFYDKVLADPLISGFFGSVDMESQKRKQKAFLTMVFGGPNEYTGRNMREAHAKLVTNGLTDKHFDAVVGHLAGTLQELGVSAEAIGQVAGIAESVRADVLGK